MVRHLFKGDFVNYEEKWTTSEEGIQHLRELAVPEVIYSHLDDNQVSKDLNDVLCVWALWRKVVQNTPA